MQLLVFFLSIFLTSNAFAFSDDIEEGSYNCTGFDIINEKEYTAYATVNKRGDHYIMTWEIDSIKYEGVGLIHEEEDDIIAFSFIEDAPNKKLKTPLKTGVRIYHIDDEILKGKWMFNGSRNINSEKCVKREQY